MNKYMYLPNMNKFYDRLSETKVISDHDSFFLKDDFSYILLSSICHNLPITKLDHIGDGDL